MDWVIKSAPSPLTRQVDKFLEECDVCDVSLNEYCDDREDDFDRTRFNITIYHSNMIKESNMSEIELMKLQQKN